jgi:MFS-type transporter involved in bile tolerance (Atg22 family)
MKNSEMMKYLLAMILFNDASSTLHSVYLVYAAQLGIDTHVLLLGSVMSRWLAGVTSLAWLGMSVYLSPKAIMVLAIALTAVAIAFTAWMENEVHFFCVVFFISLSHSGSYIFSRVLLASITPQQRAAHNFGFMGMINRVAGFFGPFVFTAVSLLVDTRAGFLTLILLAILGIVVMSAVDFEKGRKFWEYEEQGERKRGQRRRATSDVGAAHDDDAESALGR